MSRKQKKPSFFKRRAGLYTLIFLVIIGLIGMSPLFEPKIQEAEADFEMVLNPTPEILQFSAIQENTLLPIPNPISPQDNLVVIERIEVIVTAYSSSTWETDDTPYLTAAGTWVKEGIIANNLLPFGTKVRIPELYGDKVFVVEDRMSWKKGNYQIDIWFPSYWEALNFGSRETYIEILEG